MSEEICKVCGSTRDGSTKHVKYGNDIDNPVKHEFVSDSRDARCREIQAGIIEMRNKCLNDVIRLVMVCSKDPLITKDGRATLITLAESMEDAGPEGFGMDLSAEASVLISQMKELEEYKAKLPADWFKDSSLETWFPLTAEELERTKAKRDSLQSHLERMPCGHRRCDWVDMIEEPDKRFRVKVCLSCRAVQEAVQAAVKDMRDKCLEAAVFCAEGEKCEAARKWINGLPINATALADALRRAREDELNLLLNCADDLVWEEIGAKLFDVKAVIKNRLAELRRIP